MEASQVYVIKAQTMEVVVPSIQEPVHLTPDQLLEGVLETAAAESDLDAAHHGTKCYYAAGGTIVMDHNAILKKSGEGL